MKDTRRISRRTCLKLAAALPAWPSLLPRVSAGADAQRDATEPKPVAGIVTVYNRNSHADVILGKILEGWQQDGGPGPKLKLASLYVDQMGPGDLARPLSEKFGFPIFDSIEKAVTVGGNTIPVAGVLSIGEHGNYPHNEIGQHLYPRRRFFDAIADTFEKHGRVVPVFNDKHLGPVWSDALAMYRRARDLKIPLMAGSSLSVGNRTRDLDFPLGSDVESAVTIGYGPLEAYGFHALEFYQFHVERREGAERGVRSVQFLQGAELWRAVDDGAVARELFDAAFEVVPKPGQPDPRRDERAGLYLFEYVDGFRGAVFMLGCVHGTSVAVKLKDRPPLATAFDELREPRFPHFAYLLKGIERMVHTGRPSYPVERTLLTSGILDRVLTSRARGGTKLETPELKIAYQPIDYPHASHVDLHS